tara:strand:- start:4321 stop:4599 length:279 start_codon:yes stop_codon:yes gene_type:complete
MIDTEKYEGHTEGPWYLIGAQQIVYDKDNNPIAEVEYFAQEHHSYYNKALIADAPLLLAEVKRLREGIKQMAENCEYNSNPYLGDALKELIE